MKRKKINSCFVALLIVLTGTIQGQNVKDSSLAIPLTGLHFSLQNPAADMADRFGTTGNAGVPFYYKTRSNFIFGGEFNYFFGKKVKEDVLAQIKTSEGTLTNSDGNPGLYRIQERGWAIHASVGKVFSSLGHNKNSGLIATIGAGYLQHKIHITDVGRNLAQINGDYKKGYDRLTGGPMFHQFVGYLYLSNNRLANFIVGFECTEGFTKGLRGYQFDLMSSDSNARMDVIYGARIGWILPLYKRVAKDFYFN